uniref:Putative ribonuclease H protein At1g65750 family n=1 Tax=Tanacetum cinerariifolium TaxID=118510 RepID=A0A6L2JP44_TANCI|nr:putative ribonuclease H protein At1g65750 family [Tanacetum cinerariifolium]
MSHENTPRPNKRQPRKPNRSNPPTPDGTFTLQNPSPNTNLLRPQSYYHQPYPNQPYRNPTAAPQQYGFHAYGSQPNAFKDYSSQHSSFPFSHQDYVLQTQMGGLSSQPMSPINAFPIKEFECGNTRKKDGFWVEVMEYIKSKTKMEGRRTYDMVVGKWKMVRPAVVRFCGVYSNVMRMAQESGAGDEDYVQKAMGSSKKHESSGSSSFNTESEDASINLNSTVADDDEVQEIRRPWGRDKAKAATTNKGSKASASSTMNDDALAKLVVNEMTTAEVEQREAFIELKRRENNNEAKENLEPLNAKVMSSSQEIPVVEHNDHLSQKGTNNGGSVLDVMEDVIRIGQAMGYSMEGLGHKTKKEWIKALTSNYKLNFIAIQETKMSKISHMDVRFMWGNTNYDFVCSDSLGNSGGILCIWEATVFKKENVTILDNFIAIYGSWLPNNDKILFIAVYAPQQASNLDSGLVLETIILCRLDLKCKLLNINDMESKDYIQKSKVTWAIEGDENLKIFHGIINKKRSQLAIRGIFVDGSWCTEPGMIKEAFVNHFEARFKEPDNHRFKINFEFPKRLSQQQADDLERAVSRDDIKTAVWNCGDNKSPGPDGYSFGFIKKHWDLIGTDLCEAVEHFFVKGSFPNGCNSSFIALIPKVSDAKFVSDFRPISLIGCVYKVVTKVIANRLTDVISDIVSDTQSAFVSGRQILDGPFILGELLQWCKRKNKQSMFFKVDFAKAYDSIQFGVNGFEDDAMFIGEWSDENLKVILNTLKCFFLASGLHINIYKSQLLGVGVSYHVVQQASSFIGCSIMQNQFRYLGVIDGDRMTRIKAWENIIIKLKSRLSKWKVKTLSVGGRLTLLKFVLGASPIYSMSIFKVPRGMLKTMEAIRSRFFNGIGQEDAKITWISWNKVLASKKRGGLGVSSFFALNRAYLLKWVWQFISQDGSLWSRVIRALYEPNIDVHSTHTLSNWCAIVRELQLLKDKGFDFWSHCKKRIGNGTDTSFCRLKKTTGGEPEGYVDNNLGANRQHDGNHPHSFASFLHEESSRIKVTSRTLEIEKTYLADVLILMLSVLEVQAWFDNTLYGNFLRKKVTFSVVEMYILNAWQKHGVQKNSCNVITCLQSWGHIDYAQALVDIQADRALKDRMVISVPNPDSNGVTMHTIKGVPTPHVGKHGTRGNHSLRKEQVPKSAYQIKMNSTSVFNSFYTVEEYNGKNGEYSSEYGFTSPNQFDLLTKDDGMSMLRGLQEMDDDRDEDDGYDETTHSSKSLGNSTGGNM